MDNKINFTDKVQYKDNKLWVCNDLEAWLSLSFLGRKVSVSKNGEVNPNNPNKERDIFTDVLKVATYVLFAPATIVGLLIRYGVRKDKVKLEQKIRSVAEYTLNDSRTLSQLEKQKPPSK